MTAPTATQPGGHSITTNRPAIGQLQQNTDTRALIEQLLYKLTLYLPKPDITRVHKAIEYGAEAHRGQFRKSGEPFIHHPLHVAITMADLHLDTTTLIAGILHDVIEDTEITHDELDRLFDRQIADIVDGVSKIDHVERRINPEQVQAHTLQKMILATSHDMRVILVKLVDRLHNMRTLNAMPSHRQRRIALETLQVYAAIAHRLGMDKVRRELENLGFHYLYPLRSRTLRNALKSDSVRYRETLNHMRADIRTTLNKACIDFSIEDRRKTAYNVYRKMVEKRRPFSAITDIFGFRIVVSSVDDAYRVLGILHNLYKPLPGKFKDYIALPKENGYQSLHTVLFGAHGLCVETQIRTRDMDTVAEDGIAAHHLYKIGGHIGNTTLVKARKWVANLMELHEHHTDNTMDFMESVKLDLFPNEVYVFTPKGDIYDLPRGATALDFAFAVHTDVGLYCSAAQIDNQPCALSSELITGQTVQITTSDDARPSPDWLDFLVTAKARAAVHNYLKKMLAKDAIKLGHRLMQQTIDKYVSSPDKSRIWQQLPGLLKELGLATESELFYEVGIGKHAPNIIVVRLLEENIDDDSAPRIFDLSNAKDLVISYARCCFPLPQDKAVGVFKSDHGFVVHRAKCANLPQDKLSGKTSAIGKLEVVWPGDKDENTEYHAAIRVEARHERGVLATIADKIAAADSNIEHVHFEGEGGPVARLYFELGVHSRDHLNKVMRRIRNSLKNVRVTRVGQNEQTETLSERLVRRQK